MNTIISIGMLSNIYTLAMISDGCCDWNTAKHMTHVTKRFVTGRGVLIWVFGMYQYLILMPPKEANNQ